jgi:hypothetical protein
MKTRILLVLALVLVLIVAGSVSVAAKGAVVPFKAFYAMQPRVVGTDPQGCNIQELPGEGRATHLGKSTFYSDAVACPAAGTQYGTLIFTAANGDQLIGAFSGVAAIVMTPAGPLAEFSGTGYVTGGTGRFAGYTGTLDYWGTAWPVQGTGELYFDGTLTKP